MRDPHSLRTKGQPDSRKSKDIDTPINHHYTNVKVEGPLRDPHSLRTKGQPDSRKSKDIDTDYAHLPVRTFLLFEALGRPEWVSACDWYMTLGVSSRDVGGHCLEDHPN